MAILLHGTTQQRALQIVAGGPDPDFIEPGDYRKAKAFYTCLQADIHHWVGTPEEYARGKAAQFIK